MSIVSNTMMGVLEYYALALTLSALTLLLPLPTLDIDPPLAYCVTTLLCNDVTVWLRTLLCDDITMWLCDYVTTVLRDYVTTLLRVGWVLSGFG